MIDFSNCELDKVSSYEGSDQKRGIIYKNRKYMLKFSDRINTEKQNDWNSSYSNSVYSEYICCEIIKMLGYDVQNTLLGKVEGISRTGKKKIIPVVACENFIDYEYQLIEFKKIANSVLIDKPGKIPSIEEIYEVLGKDNKFLSGKIRKEALNRYWDTFIIDALIGNFDRHGNNWGYLINKKTNIIKLAPIYDCGSCLYPQLSDNVIKNIINSEEELNKRIDVYPNAALLIEGNKVNYKEYINSYVNQDCTDALLRVFPKIDLQAINDIINKVDEISDERKKFYRIMIENRYRKILLPAYEKEIERLNTMSETYIKYRR